MNFLKRLGAAIKKRGLLSVIADLFIAGRKAGLLNEEAGPKIPDGRVL